MTKQDFIEKWSLSRNEREQRIKNEFTSDLDKLLDENNKARALSFINVSDCCDARLVKTKKPSTHECSLCGEKHYV